MLHISFIDNTINRQEYTQFLNNYYKRLNKVFKKFELNGNKKCTAIS